MAADKSNSSPPQTPYHNVSEQQHVSDVESDDHFSDALTSPPATGIPTTHVTRVDSTKFYGEVPGTVAFEKRTMDAQPDELSIDNPWTEETEKHNTKKPTPVTLVEEVAGGHVESKGHEMDAEPDLIANRTAVEEAIEEVVETESGQHSNPSLPQPDGAGLAPPKSPELKAVDEHDIGTTNVHIPTVPKSPRLTITRERSKSEVEPLELVPPLDQSHLEPPTSPQLQALDEYDISSSNVAEPTAAPLNITRSRSPTLKVDSSPLQVTPPEHRRTDSLHLEPPMSPELKAVDSEHIESANARTPGRPRSPSLVVTDADKYVKEEQSFKSPERVDTFFLEPPRSPELDPVDEVDISASNVREPNPQPPTPTTPSFQISLSHGEDVETGVKTPRVRRKSSARSLRSLRSKSSRTSLKAPPSPNLNVPGPDSFAYDETTDGVQDAEDDDDFGDFDDFDDFEEYEGAEESIPEPGPAQPTMPTHPIPDFTSPRVKHLVHELVNLLFPPSSDESSSPSTPPAPLMLTPRSHSLWTQLTSPPPLHPPNWTQSRTRRLFLVSLGVPVDLDELLPKKSQKKLVLPSQIDTATAQASLTPRPPPTGAATATGNTPAQPSTATSRTPAPPPPFNHSRALALAETTPERLSLLTIEELKAHVAELEECTRAAGEVLTYWLAKRERAEGEKEAFEGVIESLVGWARRKRGGK